MKLSSKWGHFKKLKRNNFAKCSIRYLESEIKTEKIVFFVANLVNDYKLLIIIQKSDCSPQFTYKTSLI